ncbi:FAD-binding oxidoreductase [Leucobacter triazinivorans]|uniref:FAD-binding protein n=1 Tax=Leucobacter triazinivorans TaxID=1784719 RepID=A0A4P6KI30_9MICO|nr:FAD-linked oxidase C-terminal domain-containing protein [Leucobacter triazinivorans]QBE49983.1 FAD-binding protein [Leucobacter triazinivorans]
MDGGADGLGADGLGALRDALGERLVIDPELIAPYARDSSRAVADGAPRALVLAETTADVSAALAWAHAARVPVSVRGAGTGLTGGAMAYAGGIIVSLERMSRILEIDSANRIAVVQPGVITGELDDACREQGLFFPPDPASARLCTVGGNIATNAGGLRCVAHGVTSDSVAGLEVVLADGRVMRTGARTRKNAVGYDLTSLFVGSEGTLGVVTEATVRLKPVREGLPRTFRASFDRLEDAGRAVTAIVGGPAQVEVLELMDALSVEIIESFRPSGLVVPAGAMLVGQTVGADAETAAGIVTAICAAHGATDTEISESDALLEARRLSNPALNARGLKISCDVGVPVARLAEMFHGVAEISARHGLRVSTVAHAGDGNLHSTVESPDDAPGIRAADAVIDDITRLALSLDGTISGEHGIGSVKRHELPWQLDDTALAVQQAIKDALDPRGILTPGRAI